VQGKESKRLDMPVKESKRLGAEIRKSAIVNGA
jgi:hypothetical protein